MGQYQHAPVFSIDFDWFSNTHAHTHTYQDVSNRRQKRRETQVQNQPL